MNVAIIKYLNKNKSFSLKAEGESMLPLLMPGDIVYGKREKFSKVQVNDIVLVKKRKKYFIHRVIYRTFKYLIVKGDHSINSDGKIYLSQLIGKIYKVKRKKQLISIEDNYLFQSSLYFQEIVKISKLLTGSKIDFVFLKGLPIHLYFEKTHTRKIYADCDVLFKRENIKSAEKIFEKLGYVKQVQSYSKLHKTLKDKPTEYSFYKKINNFLVIFDLHFEPVFLMNQLGRLDFLYPQKLLDEMTSEFLKRKRIVDIQEYKLPILSMENLVIYLSLHFFHHNYRGIHRLELIGKIIKLNKNRINWIQITEKINDYKVKNFVYPGFSFLRKYYSTLLPSGFMNKIKPDKDKLEYINTNLLKINIFDDERRVEAGINRFKNIFYLSAQKNYLKFLIFFSPSVIYSVFWVLVNKLRFSFSGDRK